jgi:hypothetical protein
MLDLVIGRRELGKTTFAVNLSRHYSTRVIFDPRHMISTSRCIFTEEDMSELYVALDTEPEIIIRPKFDKQLAFEEMCLQIYGWLQDNPGEPFCLLIDECRFLPEPEKNQHFDFIVRCLPSAQVMVILTCHGVIDVSTDLRRIADHWILFHLTMESDLGRVRERCGDTVADEVQKLEPFQYIVWNDQKGEWRKVTEKQKWFVKLNSPPVVTV